FHDHARSCRNNSDARGTRNWRGLDEGLYLATRFAGSAGFLSRTASRQAFAGSGAPLDAGIHAHPAQDRNDSAGGGKGFLRGAGAAVFPTYGLSVSRARRALSDRAGRRIEVEGNFLHSRGRLSIRRNEAWAERID